MPTVVDTADTLLAKLLELGAEKVTIHSWPLDSSPSGRVIEVSWLPKRKPGSPSPLGPGWRELQALSLVQGLGFAVQEEEERQKRP